MSGVIRWEEPSPAIPGRKVGTPPVPWSLIAEQLKARPGVWGVIYEGSHAPHIQQRIKAGTSPWFRPKEHFEVTTRGQWTGMISVYARYVGEMPP